MRDVTPPGDSVESSAEPVPPPNATAGSGRSLRKRLVFVSGALMLGVVLAEATALAILYIQGYSLTSLHAMQDDLAKTGIAVQSARESIHPYLGWVLNPQTHPGVTLDDRHIPVNAFGLLDDTDPLPRRSADRLIVAILGGSVAWNMSAESEALLLEKLAARPETVGREIVLLRLSLAGYKQPQQVMALSYMLVLGAEIDVAVNIDGYNETALATTENHAIGVFLSYPRMWHQRTADIVDPREYGATFRLLEARANRQLSAMAMMKSPLRWSPTRNLIWLLQEQSYNRTIIGIGRELVQKEGQHGRGFHSDGPRQLYDPGDEDALFRHATEVWANSSRQLHRLCAANDAAYIHVLQPNQYLPNSKPMGPEELELMFDPFQKCGRAVARGYPLLISKGQELTEEGIRFADLTMLFAETQEPIYIDPYCHYNQLGNDMLAEAVADLIADGLGAREPR